MKTSLVLWFCLITTPVLSQKTGFDMGFNWNFLQRTNKLVLHDNVPFDEIRNSDRWGFDIGFSAYYIFNEKFDLRANPVIAFEEDRIDFVRQGDTEKLLFRPTLLKLSFHGIYKLSGKFPMGVVVGLTPHFQKRSKLDKAAEEKITLKRNDLNVDIGLNYLINFRKFIFQPEFRYSKSLTNAAADRRTEYGEAIDKFYRNKFTVGLYFRGQYN